MLNLIPLSDFINLLSWPGLHSIKREARLGLYKLEVEQYLLEHLDSDKTFPSNIQALKIELVFFSEIPQIILKSPLQWFVSPCASVAYTASVFFLFNNKGGNFCCITDLPEFHVSPSSACCWFCSCLGGFGVLWNWYNRSQTPAQEYGELLHWSQCIFKGTEKRNYLWVCLNAGKMKPEKPSTPP